MKIFKKVANGMIIGGAIGLLPSMGVTVYFNEQADRAHPIVEQALTEIKENFNACYDNNTRDKASCQKWEQQCADLELKLTQVGSYQTYQPFLDDKERNRNYAYTGLAGLALMVITGTIGCVAYWRRIDEEYGLIWKQCQEEIKK